MRRMLATLGTVAATATLTLAAPSAASAATGNLTVNRIPYADPGPGCLHLKVPGPVFEMSNITDSPVVLYQRADCTGSAVAVVGPGQRLNVPGYAAFGVEVEG